MPFRDNNEQIHPTKVAWVDGYGFGDRELEGVRFKVENIDGALICTGVHPADEAYLSKYSTQQRKKWFFDAVEQMISYDADAKAEDGTDVHWTVN
jgi:predicted urease superfamily metal-dependent hydrolase